MLRACCLTLCGVLMLLDGSASMYIRGTDLSAPKNVEVIIKSESSIMVTWDPPANPVAGYRVYYSMFAPADVHLWPHVDVGPVNGKMIGDLEPYTIYYVRVQALSLDNEYGEVSAEARPKVLPDFRSKK